MEQAELEYEIMKEREIIGSMLTEQAMLIPEEGSIEE
jgi:hypothetical protein